MLLLLLLLHILHFIIIIRWWLLHVLARTYVLFAAFGPACRNMSYRSLAADRVYKATTDDLQPERKNSVGTVFKKAFGTLSSSPRRRLSEPLMSGVPVIGTGNINTPLRYTITRAYTFNKYTGKVRYQPNLTYVIVVRTRRGRRQSNAME